MKIVVDTFDCVESRLQSEFDKGWEKGYDLGRDDGYADGWEEGSADGYAVGYDHALFEIGDCSECAKFRTAECKQQSTDADGYCAWGVRREEDETDY